MLSAEIDYLHGRKESIFIYQETVQKSEMVTIIQTQGQCVYPHSPRLHPARAVSRYYSKARNDSCVKAKDVVAGCLGDGLTCSVIDSDDDSANC